MWLIVLCLAVVFAAVLVSREPRARGSNLGPLWLAQKEREEQERRVRLGRPPTTRRGPR